MKKLSLAITALIIFAATYAQPKVEFSKTVHDFGTIHEVDGSVKCTFEFINSGNSDLTLNNVRASCGCTTPDWTKTPIPPGGKGFVSAVYNPKNRPGVFNKAITVSTNDPDNANIGLYIKGIVIEKQKTKSDLYTTSMGNLRFKTNHLAFMDITTKEIKTDSLAVLNDGKAPMNLKVKEIPAWLSVKANPALLQPGEEGFIIITYDGSKRMDYGLIFDKFTLVTDDTKQPKKNINVSAKVIPDFSNLSPRKLKKQPHMVFKTKNYDFGKVKKGTKIEYKFEFTNEGKGDLVILKTKASCGCTAIQPESLKIKKGGTSSIGIVFNTANRTGSQHKTVTIITNDPKNPEIILHISGELE